MQTTNKYYPAYDMSKYVRQGEKTKSDIQQLDKTPVYVPYNVSYRKTRSSSSTVQEGSAYLKTDTILVLMQNYILTMNM